MCGLSGFIGKSKNPSISYQLITYLFERSEIRGIDAAGYWGVETGRMGKVVYYKEALRSSIFTRKENWTKLRDYNLNLLLVHARGASKGVGEPCINHNNHPFTSFDKSLALIHNGKIDDNEYNTLSLRYEVQSRCDSELILRIIESEEHCDSGFSARLNGIKNVFNLINEGHMAVVLGEREKRSIWAFRNRFRPLWLVDVRDCLGQIFFVSDPAIWHYAAKKVNYFKNQKIVDIPPEEVWYIELNDNDFPEFIKKYKIKKSKPYFIESDYNYNLIKKSRNFDIITDLDDNDNIKLDEVTNISA